MKKVNKIKEWMNENASNLLSYFLIGIGVVCAVALIIMANNVLDHMRF